MKRFLTCLTLMICCVSFTTTAMAATTYCWFPPGWKAKSGQAKEITDSLSAKSGVPINPRIANSYPQILDAFTAGEPCLVYVGSFVQAIIRERGIGVPLVQAINGKEHYGSWMILKKGQTPDEILKNSGGKIAFAAGASSGESGAKAATAGQAALRVPNHDAAARAVMAGAAQAGFVKNWWWEANKTKFPELVAHQLPGISDLKNPDNVLTASQAVSAEMRAKISEAALAMPEVFGADQMARFDKATLDFSVDLMKKGKIDPLTYTW
ncbi:MAG: phosphate/phosphite/phosphonate ABC transporter substrate-binding protein [Desulfobulbaceae bacterium]|nr:phosphate/phosphite/phosphonate ABC transporter substrate-binding protein [Desulfobulbaceae bacterium]